MECLHTVLRAECFDGESYCLDFTCAQYGWLYYVHSWDVFINLYVEAVDRIELFGSTYARSRRRAQSSRAPEASAKFFSETARRLSEIVKKWFEQRDFSVSTLLALPDEEFRKMRGHMLQSVQREFGEAIDKMEMEQKYHLVLRNRAVYIEERRSKKGQERGA